MADGQVIPFFVSGVLVPEFVRPSAAGRGLFACVCVWLVW